MSPRRREQVQALDDRIDPRVARLRRATYYYAHQAAREKRPVSVSSLMSQVLFRADPMSLFARPPNGYVAPPASPITGVV
jgi:hypothetical protein